MSFLKKFFHKSAPREIPPMPPWDAIVEIMNGKQLGFADEVLNVGWKYAFDTLTSPPRRR